MRITDIRIAEAPIASAMSNAVIDFSAMTVTTIAIETDAIVEGQRVVGYGFNSNGRYAQTGVLKSRILPRLRGANPSALLDANNGLIDPVAARTMMMQNEKPGGHGDRSVAVGVVDMALWDAVAKASGQPLYRMLHDRFDLATEPVDSVWVYAAGGYYHPDRTLDSLRAEISGYLELGYRDVKIKIGGASLESDLRRIEAVFSILPANSRLAVDANGRFDLATALEYSKALRSYELMWFEEPCDPLDYRSLSVLAEHYPGRLATGENLFALAEVRNLLRHGGLRPGLDVIQTDPALSYGASEYAAILRALLSYGWNVGDCCPHGGHQYNLAIAAAFGLGGCESYPGVFQPFGGFADDVPIVDGRVQLPDAPGLGIERKNSLHTLLRDRLS